MKTIEYNQKSSQNLSPQKSFEFFYMVGLHYLKIGEIITLNLRKVRNVRYKLNAFVNLFFNKKEVDS